MVTNRNKLIEMPEQSRAGLGSEAFSDANLMDDEEESITHRNSSKKDEEALLAATGLADTNNAVWGFRVLTMVLLVCVAVTVCLVVALNEKANEEKSFETGFEELGGQLVTTFETQLVQRSGVVEKFAMELTTECKNDPNCTWPFFTPKQYELRAKKVAELAGCSSINVLPRVETEQKAAWQQYAQQNQGRIVEEGLIAQGFPEPINPRPIPPFMFNFNGTSSGQPQPERGPGPYFPIWAAHPISNRSFVMFNPYGNGPAGSLQIDAVIETHKPSFPRSIDKSQLTDEQKAADEVFQRLKKTSPNYNGDPYLTGIQPIYDELESPALKQERKVVGVFFLTVGWNTYFSSILPDGTPPVIVIIENKCNQTFTFRVTGDGGVYMGPEDFHNSKYDHLGLRTNINEVLEIDPARFKLNLGNCDYSIRVYPSEEFEDSYHSHRPLTYALALAGVFVFTCITFLIYDYLVEKRQRSVMKSALQSGKLVSSLFPEEVRNRLYQEDEAKKKATSSKGDWKAASATNAGAAPAIATLYPATTIFFADLAGFTKWSSTRTPVEVFDLLEKIYGWFDKIARRYKVFKVETIGDCYVAVTGLPEPQPDHAVILCKFSRACMTRFQTIVAELADTLGADTATLEMRVGLHSGPVTAGVLRGEKSRFQLFGDSVNTASRMESNGVKGKIHVSGSTAEELHKHGKSHWLVPREDKIVAKGKGEMQTYWVEIGGGTAASQTGTIISMSGVSEDTGASDDEGESAIRNTRAALNTISDISEPAAQSSLVPAFTDEIFV